MGPAEVAAANGIAGLVREYGVTGLLALSMVANLFLLRWWRECSEARIADAGRFATLIERAATTMATVATALESRTGIFERLGGTIEDGQRRGEGLATQTLSLIEEVRRELGELRRDLDEMRRGRRA